LMETSWRFSTTTFSSFSNHENTRTLLFNTMSQ
jgi:hypothetical protein